MAVTQMGVEGGLEEDDDPEESEKHTKLHSGKMNRTSISPV